MFLENRVRRTPLSSCQKITLMTESVDSQDGISSAVPNISQTNFTLQKYWEALKGRCRKVLFNSFHGKEVVALDQGVIQMNQVFLTNKKWTITRPWTSWQTLGTEKVSSFRVPYV